MSYRWYLCANYMFPKNDQISPKSTYEIKYKSQGVPGGPKTVLAHCSNYGSTGFWLRRVHFKHQFTHFTKKTLRNTKQLFLNLSAPLGTGLLEPVTPEPII